MSVLDPDYEERTRRDWNAAHGPGSPWPQGRGHDYCWDPFNCISCGCSRKGPGLCHLNQALGSGWRPIAGEGTLTEWLDKKDQWNADMRRIDREVREDNRRRHPNNPLMW